MDDDAGFDFVKLSDDQVADACWAKNEDFVSVDNVDVLNQA